MEIAMYPTPLYKFSAIAYLLFLVLAAGCVAAQSPLSEGWPSHSLTFITPAPPGGAVDLTARVISEGLAARLGRPVVVEARPGADGIIAAEAFLGQADRDHTFMVTFGGLLISNPVSYDKLPYDPERDFVPVSMLVTDTIAICANVNFAADDLAGLVSLMRTHPEAVRWSSAPGEPRLRFFGFLKQVDAKPLHVPYKATSQAVIDMIAGRIDVMISPLAAVLPNVRVGKLKLLAVMSAMRSPVVPDVPSTSEAGYPGLTMVPFVGLFARRGTDRRIVDRLNGEIGATLADSGVRGRLVEAGLTPNPGSPALLGATIAAKLRENRELARAVGPISQ
jgi:tripartite-type tricarboxylate transporter receptor subunit TctC